VLRKRIYHRALIVALVWSKKPAVHQCVDLAAV